MRKQPLSWYLTIVYLIIAGEIIFSLPFHITRFFRPTFLEVFQLSNAALGDIFAVYGITAMLAYFPGGIIADYFSARKLMALSLLATAIGGLYMAQVPTQLGLSILFAYWGITSILLFWAAMIKATREWGGTVTQGKAFGLLDGGRGLVAASVALIATFIFKAVLPSQDLEAMTDEQRRYALQSVIYFYTFATGLVAALIWLFIPEPSNTNHRNNIILASSIKRILKRRTLWLQATIVTCAYCGYKGLDNYALYATDVLKMNEVAAAQFTAIATYLRPIAAITAGILADRFLASKTIMISFILLLASYLALSLLTPSSYTLFIIYANLIITFCSVFAIRGIYFALLSETQISPQLTGAAVGLVSVIGFTPDIFFAPIAGRILDAATGLPGQQNFFMLLVVCTAMGLLATIMLIKNKHA